MGSFIGFEIQGMDKLKAILSKLPPEIQDFVVDDCLQFLLRVYRSYPPQRSVTRKQAYGKSFFSDKQRRYFFAALHDGRITVPYKRTQALSRGWQQVGQGRSAFLANETPHAGLMMGRDLQSRMAKLGGWLDMETIAEGRVVRLIKIAEAAARKALKRFGG